MEWKKKIQKKYRDKNAEINKFYKENNLKY